MYKTYSILFLVFILSRLTSFSQGCTASFNYDINGTTINFWDMSYASDSSNIISWSWSFGDDSTSTEENPMHTYSSYGTYYVCLTITTNSGCTDTYCDSIVVENNPCSGFYVTATVTMESAPGTNDGSIDIHVQGGTPPYVFSWSTGDTTEDLYNLTAGTYCVTVTDYNSCVYNTCFDVFTDTNAFCLASFSYLPGDCPNCIEFYDSSQASGTIISWYWDFGNGSYSSLQNPQQTYLDSGIYVVTLTITTSDSCTSTYSDTIYINQSIQAFSVSGQVFADSNLLTAGTVQLYSDNFTENHPPFYSAQIENGAYFFPQVASGNYKLLAIPNYPESDEFSPTYFGNKTSFSEAYVLPVYADLISVDVHLQPKINENKYFKTCKFKVYPVPFHKSLWIKSENPVKTIKIYSSTGELIFQKININSKYFKITPKLFQGVFLLKIQTENNVKVLKITYEK